MGGFEARAWRPSRLNHRSAGLPRPPPAFPTVETYDAVVIGAGQAGLSASYHLKRRGLSHVVLDADDAPGGAWQHRWDSLTMHDVHGIAALPDARPAGRRRTGAPTPSCRRTSATTSAPTTCPCCGRCGSTGSTDAGTDLLVVHAGDRTWTDPHDRQRDRHLDPAAPPLLPGRGRLPRRAAAHGLLPRSGALPRPAGRRGRRRRARPCSCSARSRRSPRTPSG